MKNTDNNALPRTLPAKPACPPSGLYFQKLFHQKAYSAARRQALRLMAAFPPEDLKRGVPFSEALHDSLDCREASRKALRFYGEK